MSRCTPEALQSTIDHYIGGSDGRTRHPLNRSFIYTEGVKEIAELAGAYWLLDILATECAPALLKLFLDKEDWFQLVTFTVNDSSAGMLTMASDLNKPAIWSRSLEYTDFPPGQWKLYLAVDQVVEPGRTNVVAMLPTEY